MFRRGARNAASGASGANDPSWEQHEEWQQKAAQGWEQHEARETLYQAEAQEGLEDGPAHRYDDYTSEREAAFTDAADAALAPEEPGAYAELSAGEASAAYHMADAEELDAAEAGDDAGMQDDMGWNDASEDENQAEELEEEHALVPAENRPPAAHRSSLGRMLARLSGEPAHLAVREPRATGAILIPGHGKQGKPGALGHTPLVLQGRRRPFTMHVLVATLGLITVLVTIFAVAPQSLDWQVYTQVTNSFNALAGLAAPSSSDNAQYHWYVVHYGDSLQSIANRFGVQPGGILLLNGLQDADQLYVGMRLKIPTDRNYGKNAPVGVVNIPPPPPDKVGNVFGTSPWNSTAAATNPQNICAPQGNADTQANRQAFQLINPNPNSSFARGFTWYHNGVDLDNPAGTPILAAQAGLVLFAGWDTGGLGWSVKINNCWGLSTIYGHMANPPLVHAGDYVQVSQQIGVEGSTGNSTGPHLHFMTEWWNKPANPYCFDFNLPAGNTPCTA